jgi:hypothetical protein
MRTEFRWRNVEIASPYNGFLLVQIAQVREEMGVPDFLFFQSLLAFVSHAVRSKILSS